MRSIHFDVSIKLFIVGLLFLTTFSLSAQDSTLVKPEPIRVSLVQFLTDMDQINNFLSEMDQDLFVNSLDVLISDWKESEPSLDSIQIDLDYRLENSVRYRELLNIKRNIGFLEIKLVDIKERYSVKQDDYEAALINIHKYDTVVNLYKEKRDSLQKNDRELLRVTTKRLRSSERKLEKVLMQFVRFQSQLNRRIWKLKITKLAANNRMSNIFSNFKKDTTETLSTIGVKDRTDPKVLLSHNFVIKKEIGWKHFMMFIGMFLLFVLLVLLGKRNFESTKLFYISTGTYDKVNFLFKHWIIFTLVQVLFLLALFFSSYSGLVVNFTELLMILLLLYVVLKEPKLAKYRLSLVLFFTLMIGYGAYYILNEAALWYTFFQVVFLILYLLSVVKFTSKGPFIKTLILAPIVPILFGLGCVYTGRVVLGVGIVDVINVTVILLSLITLMIQIVRYFLPPIILPPSLVRASFMRRSFRKHQKRIEWTAVILLGFLGLNFLLNIYGLDLEFFDIAKVIWNSELKMGAATIQVSSILMFFISITFSIQVLVFLKNVYLEFSKSRNIENSVLFNLFLNVSIYSFGIIFALYVSGVDVSSLTFIVSALSVGVGFGLQNIVSNFISGIILAVEKPIRKDDTVELNADVYGKVERIGVRASVIKTWDGAEVLVPNSDLISGQVINWTLTDKSRRLKVIVGVDYSSDISNVINVMKTILNANPKVLSNPEPMVVCSNFLDSSVEITAIVWTEASILKTKSELAVRIFDEFKRQGITIPFPQRDIHIINYPEEGEESKEE